MTEQPLSTDHVVTSDLVTCADLSRLIRRVAHLYDGAFLGNESTRQALSDLAEFLKGKGNLPADRLVTDRTAERLASKGERRKTYTDLSLEEIESLIASDPTKRTLLTLAQTRFGIPEARLRRMPSEEVVEAIRAAVSHEQSLDVIERNAEASGRIRKS